MNFWSFRRLLTKPQFISKKMLCYCVCLKCAWSINFVDFFHSSVMYIQFGSKCAKLSCVSENELTPAIGLAAFQIAGTSTLDDRWRSGIYSLSDVDMLLWKFLKKKKKEYLTGSFHVKCPRGHCLTPSKFPQTLTKYNVAWFRNVFKILAQYLVYFRKYPCLNFWVSCLDCQPDY